jgi:hypothetical protein
MAYEYNPHSARFDIPNPHRVENIFVAVCTSACFLTAIALLVHARDIYLARDYVRFGKSIVAAVSLLALAVTYAFLLMRQMRFFFGRGQPADLVPSLRPDEQGYRAADRADRQIADAAALRQTLQQNAISYRIPRGPIDNLLYTLVRDLVYSPRLTQMRVRAQFRNLLGLAFLLVLFPISLAGIQNAAAIGWIGCFYFVLTNVLVLRPLATGRVAAARFSEQTVIAFIAAAIVVPVVLASLVPANGYPLRGIIDVIPVTFITLAAALGVTALVFKAGIANTVKPTQIAIAPHLETPSVNTTPTQIATELARELQRLWEEQVPNRTYMRILPDVSARQGAFTAHVIEETQPLPVDTEPLDMGRAIALATTRWLVAVDAACTVLTILGAAFVVWGAVAPLAYTTVITGGALVVIGAFGIRSANEFWRRFAFTSRIYWVDWNGNYARAATKIGAVLSDRVHSEREVVTVESMTLRVWVADIDSVAFNTDRDRDLIAIRGLPDEAKRLCQWLAAFAENQGSIVAPTSAVDRARLEAINVLNAAVPPPAFADLPTTAMPIIGSGTRDVAVGRFCTQCGTVAASPDAAYCGSCGARLP